MFLLKACCRLELNLSPYLYQGNFKTLVVVVNICIYRERERAMPF